MFAVINHFRATQKDSRRRLQGVLIEAHPCGARLTATDGYILGTVTTATLGTWTHPPTIVPPALADWMGKHPAATLAYDPETGTLTGATLAGETMTDAPIGATYPNWRAVWPTPTPTPTPHAPHPGGFDARLVARICKAAAVAAKLTGAQPERMPLQFETFPNSNNRFTVALDADGARLSGVIMPLRDTAAPMPERPL